MVGQLGLLTRIERAHGESSHLDDDRLSRDENTILLSLEDHGLRDSILGGSSDGEEINFGDWEREGKESGQQVFIEKANGRSVERGREKNFASREVV